MRNLQRCHWCKAPEGEHIRRSTSSGVWRRKDCPPGTPWRNTKGNITTFDPTDSRPEKVNLVRAVADQYGTVATVEQWRQENDDDDAPAILARLEKGEAVRVGGGAAPLFELRMIRACAFCASHQPAEVFERGRRLAHGK